MSSVKTLDDLCKTHWVVGSAMSVLKNKHILSFFLLIHPSQYIKILKFVLW